MPCSSTVRFARHRTDPSGSDFMEERAQRKNHGDDGCRCEGSRNDADRSAGMIGNYAIRDRRQSPGADDAGIEQRESAADLAFARQLWNSPVEDRGRAVENDAKKRQKNEDGSEWQHQRRNHEQGSRRFRDDHTPNDAETLTEPALCPGLPPRTARRGRYRQLPPCRPWRGTETAGTADSPCASPYRMRRLQGAG